MIDSSRRGNLRVQEVVEIANHLPEGMRLPVLLIAHCQLRVGEVLALSREDIVDGAAGMTLYVRWRVVVDASGTGFEPSKHPSAEIQLPEVLVEQIREHLAGCEPEPDTLLFLNSTGEPWSTVEFSRSFRAALSAAGVPVPPPLHRLRHVLLG